MYPITASLIVFAFVFGSAMLGIVIRLPRQHIDAESKDVVRVGIGLLATLVAVVLGLLVEAANTYYDTQVRELTQISTNVVMLDRALAFYGPETRPARELLRSSVARTLHRMWPADDSLPSAIEPESESGSRLYESILQLEPRDEIKRTLQSQALNLANGLGATRWLIYEQRSAPIPTALLVIMVLVMLGEFRRT